MKVVYDATPAVSQWVAHNIKDCARGFGECKALGVVSGKDLIAGVVFHNWHPESETIEVSSAAVSPKWATRSILTELFGYPFSFCRMVVARQSAFNERSRRLWRAFGATEYIIKDLRADGEAEIVATLHRSQWVNSRFYNGQK